MYQNTRKLQGKNGTSLSFFKLVPRSDPAETRTLDPLIKSQLLYQLSYGVKITPAGDRGCKNNVFIRLMPTVFQEGWMAGEDAVLSQSNFCVG